MLNENINPEEITTYERILLTANAIVFLSSGINALVRDLQNYPKPRKVASFKLANEQRLKKVDKELRDVYDDLLNFREAVDSLTHTEAELLRPVSQLLIKQEIKEIQSN